MRHCILIPNRVTLGVPLEELYVFINHLSALRKWEAKAIPVLHYNGKLADF